MNSILEALVVADLVAEPAALLEEDAHQYTAPAPRGEMICSGIRMSGNEPGAEEADHQCGRHLVEVVEQGRVEESIPTHLHLEAAVALLELELVVTLALQVGPFRPILVLEGADEELR